MPKTQKLKQIKIQYNETVNSYINALKTTSILENQMRVLDQQLADLGET